jgi:hypothetical protein
MRRCDVAIGTIGIDPSTGRPFEVTCNNHTSDANVASGWRTLHGTDLATGDDVTTIDIWQLSVQAPDPADVEAAGYAARQHECGRNAPNDTDRT